MKTSSFPIERQSSILPKADSTRMKVPELLPPSDMMYRALINRDSSFEGIFFVGVRTTGIFCRPTCSAKKPARQNVDFFSTPSEALHGG
jgi:methylphosphotriester-DNA--protein-cysteine methyltransferase